MQLHHYFLPTADAFDALVAGASRARWHALAAAARIQAGGAPIPFIAGPAHPHRVLHDGALARHLLYPAAGKARGSVLVVASLINRYYVLDLLPDLSAIALLAGRGFDVHVLDWKAPGAAGPALTFADYVDGVIPEAARRAGACAVLGYCMGGTMAALFAARRPGLLRALVLLGTPIDFHRSGELSRLTDRSLFDADLTMDAYGNMPPLLMQSGFKLLNPVEAWSKLASLLRDGGDEERVRHFVALEAWLDDNVAFPGGVYRDYITRLYQDNALVRGEFRVGGTVVDLSRITVPLLDVVALRDRICAPDSSRALLPLVGSQERRLLEADTGHIGLTASRRSLAEVWPEIASWLEERC